VIGFPDLGWFLGVLGGFNDSAARIQPPEAGTPKSWRFGSDDFSFEKKWGDFQVPLLIPSRV